MTDYVRETCQKQGGNLCLKEVPENLVVPLKTSLVIADCGTSDIINSDGNLECGPARTSASESSIALKDYLSRFQYSDMDEEVPTDSRVTRKRLYIYEIMFSFLYHGVGLALPTLCFLLCL